ncbi:tRNA uracil 4-sulfurtransferase ThiI [Marinobacter sp.]|uniref:tRNA uracil 4-sulfurtransferase ThiI n=1 Tax=Marinobacter sp. TaxID=50741 RepID=UPI0038504F67
MKLLIRPAPEITIKSKPVRRSQMRQLRQNVRKLLREFDHGIRVDGSWDRVEVTLPADSELAEPVLDALKRIPGISTIQEIGEFPLQDIADIASQALAASAGTLEDRSFAVRVRRHGLHDFRSGDVARQVGTVLLEQGGARCVDLRQPDITVRIEIQQDHYHIALSRHRGLGGYPLGSVESVMTLISGGYDSSVAAWLMMRRGIRSHFLFFNLGGANHEDGVRQVVHYLWSRYGASHSAKFISVPFDGVVAEIMQSVGHRHWGVVLKRQMLKAAEEIGQRNNVAGLVTGDAVAQVSSQTLTNLSVVDRACDQVVLRPLVSMDKEEIIRIAREIGTEPFARNMPEYCGVISQRPATRAKLRNVELDESRMDPAALAQALESRTECHVDQLLDKRAAPEEVEMVTTPVKGDVIIDLRHPTEGDRTPLCLSNNDIVRIPFYELSSGFAALPPARRFLLYCDRGTMSRIQAGQLQAEGHTNISVYAPVH